MTVDAMNRAVVLSENMKSTERALQVLTNVKPDEHCNFSSICKGDGIPNMCICEYDDGAGYSARLFRAEGNKELLDVIVACLTKQLKAMQEEFTSL